jgi:hypothetical protein
VCRVALKLLLLSYMLVLSSNHVVGTRTSVPISVLPHAATHMHSEPPRHRLPASI